MASNGKLIVTDKYAVFGHPIGHSLSPLIHRLFAEALAQDMEYTAVDVEAVFFVQELAKFCTEGGVGANITLPFKGTCFHLIAETTQRASLARAVNTLIRMDNDTWRGDNTDGFGLLNDLQSNLGVDLHDARILIVGAGGAAQGIIAPLLSSLPSELVITNRNPEKAHLLAQQFAAWSQTQAASFPELSRIGSFDLVIHATSAGLSGQCPSLPKTVVRKNSICYDISYSHAAQPFCKWAKKVGVERVHDGLGMLVEQAAESFYLWRGLRPQTLSVIHFLREQLATSL